jgi:NTE family protein
MEEGAASGDPLRDVPLFAGLAPELRAELAARAATVEVRAGEWLFRRGDPGDSMYVVLAGRLEVLVESPQPAVIRVAGNGSALGELALLTDSVRSASVRARRDSRLLRLAEDRFSALLREEPAFAVALARTLGTLLQQSRALASEPAPLPATIAVAPTVAGLPVAEVAGILLDQLGPGTAVLDEPVEGPGARLDRAERESERVLLVSAQPPGSGAWGDFCVRQADRALLLAEGTPPADIAPATGPGRRDVLLAGAAPRGALAAWLDALGADGGRRIGPRERWAETLRPIARSLTGRSTGVVLSGGGARGLAHIGVLEALLEAGIKIDRVAGCSMGALVGAQFAMGVDPDGIHASCEAELVRRNPLGDYTLPLVSVVRGLRAKAMVERMFGERLIEELPREFLCASCDLVTSELVLHRRGRLFEAVGASFCLPGIGPPVVLENRLLVDGGVLNNLPVEPLAIRGEGPLIASDVTAQFQVNRPAGAAGRARARLRELLLGLGNEVPLRLPEVLVRTLTLGSIDTVEESQRHAHLVIRPAVSAVGMVDFAQIDRLRRAGREAARTALERSPDLVAGLARS